MSGSVESGAALGASSTRPADQKLEYSSRLERKVPMDVRTELQLRGFVKAGAIRPVDSGKSCKADIKLEVRGTAVYGLVVGDQFKKCGDTGRKNATLKKRMTDCSRAINLVISGAIPGPFTENFKRLAPRAIESNQEIEVWARESTATECKSLQRELNGKYDTIRYGWANRLE